MVELGVTVPSTNMNHRSHRVSAERTLLMVKPDAVAKNAIGNILMRLEAEGFVIR